MANWSRIVYVALLIIIYIPMVFMGTNVFFDKYQYYDSPYAREPCMTPAPASPDGAATLTAADRQAYDECVKRQAEATRAWEAEKRSYDGWKYVFIAAFNLLVMLLLILVPSLEDTIVMGLFMGATLTTAFATMQYSQTNTKLGFGILVAMFVLVLGFIHHRRALFFETLSPKPRKK